MKIKYIIVTVLLFVFMTPDVYARCSKNDILRAKGDANNITLEAKRLKDSNGKYTGKYNLIFNNVTEDFYLQDKLTNNIYNRDLIENGTLIVKDIEGGAIEFDIYYEVCSSRHMKSIKTNLPKYNTYSSSALCEGIPEEEVEMCGSWYQGEIQEEILKQKVETYKETLKQQELEKEKSNTTFNKIKNFLLDYYIYIIITIVLVVIITTIIAIRKKQYSLD